MENKIANTICNKAWDYPIVNLSNNEVSMCCHSKHHKVTKEDIERLGKDIFTKFEPLVKARLDLLNGIQTENCSYCWNLENQGLKSSRTEFEQFLLYLSNNYYKRKNKEEVADKLLNLTEEEKIDIATNVDHVNNVEIALGNTCDLKCVYCNEYFSSQWITEKIKYQELPISWIKELDKEANSDLEKVWWEWFNDRVSKTTTIIGFIGGEPLIISKLYEYIDTIIDTFKTLEIKRPLYLSIVSNFNTPKQYFEKFISLISKISETSLILDLNISLESLDERTEFIRTGSKWDRLKSNIEQTLLEISKLENKKSVSFNFMLALNSLCISDLPNFIKWVVELQNKYDVPINLRGSQVVYPKWLSPTILPLAFSEKVQEAIDILVKENVDKTKYLFGPWDNYITHLLEVKKGIGLNADPVIKADFSKNIDQLNERRSLNFIFTFPELLDFYFDCKNYE